MKWQARLKNGSITAAMLSGRFVLENHESANWRLNRCFEPQGLDDPIRPVDRHAVVVVPVVAGDLRLVHSQACRQFSLRQPADNLSPIRIWPSSWRLASSFLSPRRSRSYR